MLFADAELRGELSGRRSVAHCDTADCIFRIAESIFMSQCDTQHWEPPPSSIPKGKSVINSEREVMKVALSFRYRTWMLALLPMTLGLGTAALWIRSLNWPLSLNESGITLRRRCRVEWRSIRKIRVSRSYLDGHASQICIHHNRGVSNIPVKNLRHGQLVVRTILDMFEASREAPLVEYHSRARPTSRLAAGPILQMRSAGTNLALAGEFPQQSAERRAEE